MDEILKKLGFESEAEFHRMVANVDISSPERLANFQRWQDEDGTRDGLEKLPTIHPSTPI